MSFARRPGNAVRFSLRTTIPAFFSVFFICHLVPLTVQGEVVRRHPCDPKFGYQGNYLEITTGSVANGGDMQVCFADFPDQEVTVDRNWWQVLWEKIQGRPDVQVKRAVNNCISLASLPGRMQEQERKWSGWQSGLSVNRADAVYQFALCGSDNDPAVWEDFQRYLGVDAWDGMRMVAGRETRVKLAKLRIVQNRVRILDDENEGEGKVNVLLDGGTDSREIDLSARIRATKLNRINCLNLEEGPPYCEAQVSGLDRDNPSPVITAALLELGHSGSKKYHRTNDAYCSEFSFYVIEQGAHLSQTCTRMVPDPIHDDVSVTDMFRWFKLCGRIVPREEVRENIRPGDYISVDDRKHSVTFLGWADPDRRYFWEISGNNRCLPERETVYAPNNKANMVCISKRDFDRDVRERDFGAKVVE